MKYRLKDRELQRKLDELSDGDFSRQLASNKKRIFAELNFGSSRKSVERGLDF
jgi:hypothetical protein